MVDQEMVRVLGRSAFHDTALIASGDLSYLGGEVCEFYFSGFYFSFFLPKCVALHWLDCDLIYDGNLELHLHIR